MKTLVNDGTIANNKLKWVKDILLKRLPPTKILFATIITLLLPAVLGVTAWAVRQRTSLRSKASTPTIAENLKYSQMRGVVYLDAGASRLQRLEDLKKDLPRIKETGFNTVWLIDTWADFDPNPLETPRVFNEQAFDELRQSLGYLRQNNMEAVLPLVYLGEGYAPNGIDPSNWTYDPAAAKAYEGYVSEYLRQLSSYKDIVYILLSSENAMMGNHWTDAVKNAVQIRNTIGGLPARLDPALRQGFRIGFHDYILINLDWSTCFGEEIRTFPDHCGATTESPIAEPISFDFVAMVGYEMLGNYNAAPQSFTKMSPEAIKTNLDERANRFKKLYPNTPLIMGEYGYRGCENGEEVQADIIKTMAEYAIGHNYGLSLWSWKADPSECTNVSLAGLAITNPDGSLRKAVSILKTIFNSPVIGSTGVTTTYNPWAVWISGGNLDRATAASIYDNNGQLWAEKLPLTLAEDKSFVSFSLPANSPPSGCNRTEACKLQVALVSVSGDLSTKADLTLPPSAVPEIKSGGINTAYEPWAVWLSGNDLSGGQKARLYDISKVQWGDDIPVLISSDKSFVSFALPANTPPSGCNNPPNSCAIEVRLINEAGQLSNSFSLTLPSVAKETADITLTNAGVNTAYTPWAVWVTGQNLTSGLSAKLTDGSSQWGGLIPTNIASDNSFVSFVLPSNTPPSNCNLNASCKIKVQLVSTSGKTSNEILLELPPNLP